MTKKLETKLVTVNFGPQHPAMHGVLYIKAELDGEVIADVEPNIGYLHRSMEKIFENRYYNQSIAIVDRADYIGPMFNETVVALTIEKLLGIKVPERAEYLRVLAMELNRIASHSFFWGNFGQDIGCFFTTFLWFWREREMVYDLLEEISGYRMHHNYMRVGGVNQDTPDGWLDKVSAFCDEMEKRVEVYENLLSYNEIFLARTKNVGKMTKQWCIDWGITGPLLRATGFEWDLRKNDPYSIYDQFDFDVPTGSNGDVWDAYKVRMEELKQSIWIVRQALDKIPEGPVRAKVPMKVKPPKGEAYCRVEGARGEIGCYIVSQGENKPYRMKLRAPSFINLASLQDILKGQMIADFVAIVGAYDPVMGEVDR